MNILDENIRKPKTAFMHYARASLDHTELKAINA